MAIAVIAGLTFATFLTLVLVPVMYSLTDELADFFKRHFTQRGAEVEEVRRAEESEAEMPEAVPA
jgi:hypothetical protein